MIHSFVFKRTLLISSLLLLLFVVVPKQARADSYNVTAAISYPAPTQAPTIDPSLSGFVATSDIIEIFGTCEHALPATVVSIWRDGTSIGSVQCEANNTYRLSVTLQTGANTLQPRSSSLSGLYGPDGSMAVVTYTPNSPTPSNPSQSSNPDSATSTTTPTPRASTDSEAESQLHISSAAPYELLDSANAVTVQITVGGGTGPYTIVLNWGDGSTETLIVDDPGVFSFSHTYTDPGVYRVVATVTDVLGVSKMYQFIIASSSPVGGGDNKETETTQASQAESRTQSYVLPSAITAFVLLLLISTFFFGRKYQFKQMKAELDAYEKLAAKNTKGKRL